MKTKIYLISALVSVLALSSKNANAQDAYMQLQYGWSQGTSPEKLGTSSTDLLAPSFFPGSSQHLHLIFGIDLKPKHAVELGLAFYDHQKQEIEWNDIAFLLPTSAITSQVTVNKMSLQGQTYRIMPAYVYHKSLKNNKLSCFIKAGVQFGLGSFSFEDHSITTIKTEFTEETRSSKSSMLHSAVPFAGLHGAAGIHYEIVPGFSASLNLSLERARVYVPGFKESPSDDSDLESNKNNEHMRIHAIGLQLGLIKRI